MPDGLGHALLQACSRFNHATALQAPGSAVTYRALAGQAQAAAKGLRAAGLRVEADLRNEKITYKIREHSLNKLPYQIVVGDKEMAANLVAVRTRGGQDLGAMPIEKLAERLLGEVVARSGTA